MVANIYKNQSLQLSPSFSVKDAVEQHTKETATMPLLEMESEPAATSESRRSAAAVEEYLDMPSSYPTLLKANKSNKKVTFSNDVHVHEIPMLTQEEKEGMFFTKQDKRNSKLQIKRLVTFYRAGRNNFFFEAVPPSHQQEIIQIPEEERTQIGLEAHINPQMKIGIRKRMTKLVLQHQDWSRQHPTFFDDEFLAQNVTTVAKSATLMALQRAQTVIQELKNDKQQEGPISNIRVNMSNKEPSSSSEECSNSLNHSVTILCSPEALPDATSTATTAVSPSIETVVQTEESRMEAPGQACMVR